VAECHKAVIRVILLSGYARVKRLLNLQKLKGRSVLDKLFFENDPLDELNQMQLSKKFYLLKSR
jgi:hypothetical protein